MAFVTLPHALTAGAAENINHVQANLDEIVSEINGSLDSTNLSGTAGITKAQLAAAVQEALFSAGDLKATALSAAPSGWLMCDGSAVSRTTYATLFAAISTTYGAGNGTTTFNVPDLRGRVPVGVDGSAGRLASNDSLGSAGGTETHTLTIAEMPSHDHGDGSYTTSSGSIAAGGTVLEVFFVEGGTNGNNDTRTISIPHQGGGGAHNNLQPYQVTNWMVKT